MNLDSPLKCATWNVRGLLDIKKRRSIFRKLKTENLDIICLQETHIFNDSAFRELSNLWGGPIHHSPGTNRSKGLLTLLHPRFRDYHFTKIWSDDRIIISKLDLGQQSVHVINVYSPCESGVKLDFIDHLQECINSNLLPQEVDTSVIMGDFNIALCPNLDIISGVPHKKNVCDKLNAFIQSLCLKDSWRSLHPEDKCYTWAQATNALPVARRLDYIFVGETLGTALTDSMVKSMGYSDHRMVISYYESTSFKRGKGLYKINVSLLEDNEYSNLIIKEIQNTATEYITCNPHTIWEMIKVNIKEVSQLYSRLKAKRKKDRLHDIQAQLQILEESVAHSPMEHEKWKKIAQYKAELEILEMERARGAQIRSQSKFIEEGEKCTSYFFSLEKNRAVNNTITKIKDTEGNTVTNEHKILEVISNKYKERYNKSKLNYVQVSDLMNEYIENLNLPSLDEAEKEFCDRPLSEQEIGEALKLMNVGSAPGSDGIPTEFYIKFWEHIKGPLVNCYMYCDQNDILSPSERLGVIALFHKGKDLDRENLDNWRPISLMNTDYKIIAKVFSIRLNKVIQKLIGKQQLGFLKGRQISHIHRIIDDILHLQKKADLPGMILALDFKQAFDAINIKCIIKSLEIFGFGPYFIKWIAILNNQRESCVKNGGYISELFPMGNGVRQGCSISPQLFLLAVEILAQKILQDVNIEGLNPHRGQKSKKITQYADDVALYLKNLMDLRRSISHLNGFSKFSDLFLNLNKSYALSTNGMAIDPGDIPINFKDEIKILGMYFSNRLPANKIVKNWESRINNILNIFGRWSKRNLSIIGKIHIVKTFGLSQVVFLMKSIDLPKEVLDQINLIFFKFIWKKKVDEKKAFEKIKRKVLCNELMDGGLRMIDMNLFQDSILLEWAEEFLLADEQNPWADIASHFFKRLGGKNVFKSYVLPNQFSGLDLIDSPFWKKVLSIWLEHGKRTSSVKPFSINDPISNNGNIIFRNKPLFLPNSIHRGVITVKDVMIGDRLLEYNEYRIKFGDYPRGMLDHFIIVQALKDICNRNHSLTLDNQFYFGDHLVGSLGRKFFYSLLRQSGTPLCISRWKRQYNMDIDKRHWTIVHEMKETKLRALAWKVLHNIYPTNILLYKMKLSPSQNCQTCGEIDFVEHFFYNCTRVQPLWVEISKDINVSLGVIIKIKESDVLLGLCRSAGISALSHREINLRIAIGRLVISKFRYGRARNIFEIYETECRLRKLK